MTNSVNYQNQAIPAYSGITINITNPTVNPPSAGHVCQPGCTIHNQNLANNNDGNMYTTNPTQPINPYMTQYGTGAPNENIAQAAMPTPNPAQYSYPPQYYLNNYNYVQNGEKGNAKSLTETPKESAIALAVEIVKSVLTNSIKLIIERETFSLSRSS